LYVEHWAKLGNAVVGAKNRSNGAYDEQIEHSILRMEHMSVGWSIYFVRASFEVSNDVYTFHIEHMMYRMEHILFI